MKDVIEVTPEELAGLIRSREGEFIIHMEMERKNSNEREEPA